MAPPTRPAAKAAPGLAQQLNGPTMAAGVVLFAGIVIGLYYFLLYAPLEVEAEREQQRAQRAATAQRAALADLRRYNDDVAELERARTRARELVRVLPSSADIPGFMRSINTLAESSGLSIGLIQPEPEQIEQYFARIPVRLEVSGSYLALARFFRAVSQLPRVINMENISLETPTEENGEVRLRAKFLATTFRALAAGEGAPAPAPAPAPAAGGRR